MSIVPGKQTVAWLSEIDPIIDTDGNNTGWSVIYTDTGDASPQKCMGFKRNGEVSWTMPEAVRKVLHQQPGSWYDSEPESTRLSAEEGSKRFMIQVPPSPQYDSYQTVIGHLEALDERLTDATHISDIAGFFRGLRPCSPLESHLFALMDPSHRKSAMGWLNRTLTKLVGLKFFDAAMNQGVAAEATATAGLSEDTRGAVIHIFKELLYVIYGGDEYQNLPGINDIEEWRYQRE